MQLWILAIILLGFPSASWAKSPPELAIFLDKPSVATYEVFREQLDVCDCREKYQISSGDVVRLVALVMKQDRQAIDIAFMVRQNLGGGDLEDIDKTLGHIADVRPTRFLYEVKKWRMETNGIHDIVSALPDDVVDDKERRIQLIQSRIASLSRVDKPELISIRVEAVHSLENYLSQLKD